MMVTALENLLQQAGYGRRKAAKLAAVIDSAAIPGMSADDLFSAFTRWRLSSGLTDAAVRIMTDESFADSQQFEKLRSVILELFEDMKNGQLYLNFPKPKTVEMDPVAPSPAVPPRP